MPPLPLDKTENFKIGRASFGKLIYRILDVKKIAGKLFDKFKHVIFFSSTIDEEYFQKELVQILKMESSHSFDKSDRLNKLLKKY